jgi:diguanylate cyclase (GGDEF)-like protein/PAS domain S-box-containing protein
MDGPKLPTNRVMIERLGVSVAPSRRWTRLRALRHRVDRSNRAHAPRPDEDDRGLLALIVETQREIVAAGSDVEAVMQLVLARSQELTGADGAMVSLVEGDELLTRAASGISADLVGRRRPLRETVARHAIDHGVPLLIGDCETDPRINRELQKLTGDKSLICVPLFQGGGRVIGALNVMSSSETRLTERNRETMEMLSVILSAAVSYAAEYEAKRAQGVAYGRFRTLFEGASIGIARLGRDERAADTNPALEELLGYSAAELAAMSFREFTHPEDVERSAELYGEMMAGRRDAYQLEVRFVRRDQNEVWGQITAVLERDGDGRPAFAVTMIENITQRKVAESALVAQSQLNEYQAVHDALTDLPNRTLFRQRIQHGVARSEEDGDFAVVIMDLDRFKEVNDSMGHHAGDALLIEVARRVESALRTSDMVARLGGDEFGLLLSTPSNAAGLVTVLDRVREAVEAPIVFHDLPLAISASMGVASYPDHGRDVETLLRSADVAMYAAKRSDLPFAVYDSTHSQSDPSRLTLVAELRRALQRRELVLYYQPKAGLASGAVDSVEALVRWNHPDRGLVFPDAFIPLAQETGLIRPLTQYVLEEAIRQCRAWQAEGIELSVSVNLSARNLLDVEFPDQVERMLESSGLDPARLELEITETTMLNDGARTKAALDRLSALGVRISIDDFGTGYSSLSYLRQLPISEIKIDRSFVMNMDNCEDDAVIVRSTIDLGRNLGLKVVAEGVESEAVWQQLRRLGCTAAQGYYLTRPVPADELRDWLAERTAAAADDAHAS